MSPIRSTGRHRKPRSARATRLIRGGVLSGVLSTVAVSTTSASAGPAEKPTETSGELPVVTLDGVAAVSAAEAAESTERYVAASDLEIAHQRAWARAERLAAKRRAAADEAETRAAAAAAERRAAEEAAVAGEAAAERASRTTERTAPTAEQADEPVETPATPATGGGTGSVIADFARAQVGAGYQLGATGPGRWDCSGLTQAAYAAAGISLPRTSQDQSALGTRITVGEARPGDLLYWGGAGSAYHVAVHVGDGRYVGAQNPSTGVAEHDLSWSPPTGAIRVG
jgi:cell wall-associated NlpC family hydrolase